ncbi:MAG: cytochrome C assembly family protein [Plesiomonas sp.]
MPLFATLALLGYAACLVLIIPSLLQKNGPNKPAVFCCAGLALLFHTLTLKELIFNAVSGQNLSLLNVASLVGLIITALMTLSLLRYRVWFLMPVVYSFAGINLAAARFLPGAFITHLEAHPGILGHITLALFAYATLMIATLYAIQLAWLDHRLKHKKLPVSPMFPPLMTIERQLFQITLVGEVLLTLTLVTGWFFIHDMFAQGQSHKAVLSLFAWLVYGTLLWGHFKQGWRGRRVVYASMIGAFLLTLAYFGSRFVQEVILR